MLDLKIRREGETRRKTKRREGTKTKQNKNKSMKFAINNSKDEEEQLKFMLHQYYCVLIRNTLNYKSWYLLFTSLPISFHFRNLLQLPARTRERPEQRVSQKADILTRPPPLYAFRCKTPTRNINPISAAETPINFPLRRGPPETSTGKFPGTRYQRHLLHYEKIGRMLRNSSGAKEERTY